MRHLSITLTVRRTVLRVCLVMTWLGAGISVLGSEDGWEVILPSQERPTMGNLLTFDIRRSRHRCPPSAPMSQRMELIAVINQEKAT